MPCRQSQWLSKCRVQSSYHSPQLPLYIKEVFPAIRSLIGSLVLPLRRQLPSFRQLPCQMRHDTSVSSYDEARFSRLRLPRLSVAYVLAHRIAASIISFLHQ